MAAVKKHCKNKDISIEKDDGNEQLLHLQTESVLLPGLPNHLARLCLANLPPSLLYRVCMSWRRFVYSPNFPPFYSLYALLAPITSSSPNCVQNQCKLHSATFFCFDPIAWKWRSLPTPPSTSTLPLCMLSRHPSYISRLLPIQSITASDRLVIIAANTHNFLPSLTSPLVFDPLLSKWSSGPPFTSPRRWCATGSIDTSVYVASGMGAQYHRDVARSVERWDTSEKETDWIWETRAAFRDGKFSREAIEAVGYRGKLCMVNIKGRAVKEGAVYNVVLNQWEQMPRGMLRGWTGPATTDGEAAAMYVIDQETGSLNKYDDDNDCWEELIGPSNHLKGAEHISARRGRVCAVSADGGKIFVVDISARPANFWMLEPPQGMEVVAVHILPRMSLPEHDQSSF